MILKWMEARPNGPHDWTGLGKTLDRNTDHCRYRYLALQECAKAEAARAQAQAEQDKQAAAESEVTAERAAWLALDQKKARIEAAMRNALKLPSGPPRDEAMASLKSLEKELEEAEDALLRRTNPNLNPKLVFLDSVCSFDFECVSLGIARLKRLKHIARGSKPDIKKASDRWRRGWIIACW